jgi:hypothetical protein
VSHHRLRIDRNVYLVLDDFGRMGCAWRETNVEDADLEAVIDDLLEGQYSNPVRVIGFNLSEGWARDVSDEIARKLRKPAPTGVSPPAGIRDARLWIRITAQGEVPGT